MRAVGITARPDVGKLHETLEQLELPIPEPGKHEVRIRVLASTVNIDDIHFSEGTMMGGLPVSPKPRLNNPYVPGTDVCGIVDAVGSGVGSVTLGQEVYGICSPMDGRGPWAEYCIAKSRNIARKPKSWSFGEAASAALAGAVAVSMLNSVDSLENKKCVVIGASGGIGTLCLQALTQKRAVVWAVCSQRNAETVRRLGAERVIDYSVAPISQQIRNAGEEVDVVFDLVGGKDTEREAFSVLTRTGIFVTVVGPNKYVGERKLGALGALSSLFYIGWRMLWTHLRKGPRYVFTGPTKPDFGGISGLLADAGAKPIVDTEVSLNVEDMSKAITRVASHRAVGKVVIDLR